jgi:D-arabinose 1-dehydrogenase-like Zn-dependent alcohol dehydrogenase
VQACGICHSDVLTKEGAWPGIQYPRAPGHELAGVIEEVGAEVSEWKKGHRIGVGWHGGQDNTCFACRSGDFKNCRNLKIPGIRYDGGYQQYTVAPVEALAAIPDGLSDAEAAPLLCAGITNFNSLRHSGALPSDLVAVQGIGGLAHLGIQIRQQVRLQGRGHRAGTGKRGAGKEVGGQRLHRQQIDERSGVIAEIGRRAGNSGDCT